MMKKPPPETIGLALAFQAFIANSPVIAIAVAVRITTFYFLAPFELSELVWSLIDAAITAPVAFSAHNYVVTNGERRGFRALQTDHSGALISFLALSFSVILAIKGMGWIFNNGMAHLISFVFPDELALSQNMFVALSLGLTAIIAIAALVIFGGFGTIFPAIVDGGDTSPAAAWDRQVKGAIIVRLLGTLLLTFLLVLVLLFVLIPLLGGPSGIVASIERQLLLETVNQLLSFYVTTLIATILSKAYLGSYVSSLKHP